MLRIWGRPQQVGRQQIARLTERQGHIDQRARLSRSFLRNAAITFRILLIEFASATGRNKRPVVRDYRPAKTTWLGEDAPRQRMTVLRGNLHSRQNVMTRPPLGELRTDRIQAFNQFDKIAVASMTSIIDAESGEHVAGPRRPIYDQGAQS